MNFNIRSLNQKKIPKTSTSYLSDVFYDKSSLYKTRILAVIIITISIIFFFLPNFLNIKIGLTFLIIGLFMFFLTTKNVFLQNTKDLQILIAINIWILSIFFITLSLNLDIFFIIIFLGILIIYEFTKKITSKNFNHRLNIFIAAFLFIFLIILINKLVNI
jgi:hypothetical protein